MLNTHGIEVPLFGNALYYTVTHDWKSTGLNKVYNINHPSNQAWGRGEVVIKVTIWQHKECHKLINEVQLTVVNIERHKRNNMIGQLSYQALVYNLSSGVISTPNMKLGDHDFPLVKVKSSVKQLTK